MKKFICLSLFSIFLLNLSDKTYGQKLTIKGGGFIFPHVNLFEGSMKPGIAFGKGWLVGLEYKLSKKFTTQLDYSQSFLTYTYSVWPQKIPYRLYLWNESMTSLEFRYYPTAAFTKSYFGFTTVVYTSLYGGWKDSGYKWGIMYGYVINIKRRIEIEPRVLITSDLGRYPSFDEIFGYPILQIGIFATYKFNKQKPIHNQYIKK